VAVKDEQGDLPHPLADVLHPVVKLSFPLGDCRVAIQVEVQQVAPDVALALDDLGLPVVTDAVAAQDRRPQDPLVVGGARGADGRDQLVQSRLAMLDIFMSTFILGGVLCAVLEYQRRKGIPVPTVTSNRVVGALSLAAPAPPEDGPIRRRALNAAMSLLVAPMAVYVASYLMFFVQHGPAVGEFVSLQAAMFHHQSEHQRALGYGDVGGRTITS
jgi:hypothetical protein